MPGKTGPLAICRPSAAAPACTLAIVPSGATSMATLRAQPSGSSACSAKIVGTISSFRSFVCTCIGVWLLVYIYITQLWNAFCEYRPVTALLPDQADDFVPHPIRRLASGRPDRLGIRIGARSRRQPHDHQ